MIAEYVKKATEALQAEEYSVLPSEYDTFTDLLIHPTGETALELQITAKGVFTVTGYYFPDRSGTNTKEMCYYSGDNFDHALDAAITAVGNMEREY